MSGAAPTKKFNVKQNKQQLSQRFFTMGKETSLTCIDYPCQFSNEFPASPFANIPTYACEKEKIWKKQFFRVLSHDLK